MDTTTTTDDAGTTPGHHSHPQSHGATSAPSDRDVRVLIQPLGLDFWEYEGTRAQIEAEGVLPAGIEWPEGTRAAFWEEGRFQWMLSRTRPAELKGPMRLWATGDWWSLRCSLRNNLDYPKRQVLKKQAELAAAVYRASAEGRREFSSSWDRYCLARDDARFQAFKGTIAGLIPPKRGRKPVASRTGGAA